ncbi:MAG: RNA-binding domain-containing protein [bacterium]|jgi:ATP-dependent DNA helicase RecG
MQFQKSPTVVLKRSITQSIVKDIVALANSDGGTIIIGVNNRGEVLGVKNADEVSSQMSTLIKKSIKPDITKFTNCGIETVAGKLIVKVEVEKGPTSPYYLVDQGLNPTGVFVRKDSSSAAATNGAIRRMIKETDGNVFEDMRSVNQDLTFQTATQEFSERGIDFSSNQKKALGLVRADGLYTNIALLLSDQCSYNIKAAVFEGKTKSIFKDRRTFNGSILKQLSDVYDYISMLNKTRAEFSGLHRIDSKDYPEEALREALVNSVVHRDYSYGGSTLISMFDDRIEFVSMGGLVKGITLDDVMLGISLCRNEKLAEVFYRLELIETYGTGMQKIMNSYRDCGIKPEVKVTGNAFLVMLPNMNAAAEAKSLNQNEQAVLELVTKKEAVSRKDVEALLAVSQTMAGRVIRQLVRKGLLSIDGHGMNTKYVRAK